MLGFEVSRSTPGCMPRSAVLRGLPNPRSRAKQRSRLDRHRDAKRGPPPAFALTEQLEATVPRDPPDLHSFDVTDYLRRTAESGLPAAERLRQLAVFLDVERHVTASATRAGWSVLRRIYDEAARLDPRDAWVRCSRAASALGALVLLQPGDPFRARLWREALHSARAAVDLDPADAHAHYLLGKVHYWHEPAQPALALASFEEATRREPGHAWARLYTAHCLHDLERWAEAADAYGQVDRGVFTGPSGGWRRELMLEQRAYCLLRGGRRAEAVVAFTEVIRRREEAFERGEDPLESDALFILPKLLVEAASTDLRSEIGDRARALVKRYGYAELLARMV